MSPKTITTSSAYLTQSALSRVYIKIPSVKINISITISTLFKIPTSPIKIFKKSNHKPIIPADLWPRGVAVLDERLDTDLDLDLESRLGVLDEATLLEVLVALFLLLSGVGRCVRGVAPTVIRVVAQYLEKDE